MKINQMINNVKTGIEKHNTSILLGVGLATMVVSTVSAVKATVKVTRIIDEMSEEKELDKKEIVKESWKYYIPSAIGYTTSALCFIGIATNSNKKIAALTTAYNLSEKAMIEYGNKVIEVIGEEKEKEIRESVQKKVGIKNPKEEGNVIIMPGDGHILCRDSLSGRYFRSTTNDIATVENLLNRELNCENYISLNTYYDYLGLETLETGNQLGWNISEGLIDIKFDAEITPNGQPCVVIEHINKPFENYIYV